MHKPPDWQLVVDAIKAAKSILVVAHIRPDGDAIGSASGLANALKTVGKEVTVAIDEGVPEFFDWVPGASAIVPALESGQWDLMIATDSSSVDRVGQVGDYGMQHSQRIVNIDHHPTNTYFGDLHLVLPHAASASQIVVELLDRLGINWKRDIALPLLMGLVTDTLGFRTSSTTVQELAVAQKLMQAGASLSEITYRTLGVMTVDELLLWKRILPTIEVHGNVAEVSVRRDDLRAVGLDTIDTGNIVGLLRSVREVHIAVVFREEPDGTVKISIRSDPGFDVSTVALALGGGGHKQAAGAEFAGSIDACREQVIPRLQDVAAEGELQIG